MRIALLRATSHCVAVVALSGAALLGAALVGPSTDEAAIVTPAEGGCKDGFEPITSDFGEGGSVRIAYQDRPFRYQETDDGHWACWDERLGIGAVAPTREAVYDRICAMVLERIQAMSDEEFEAHLAGCEIHYVDEHGNELPGPADGAARSA